MILICYDGSEDAKSAIQHAGTLLPGSPATVLTVWEPYITILTRTPGGMGPVAGVVDIEELDKGSREAAEREAAEGAALAHDAGIDAQSAIVARHAGVAEAILEESDRLDASAIVVGSRGRTGLGSLLLGSVSHDLVQQADCAVIVVPSPAVCERRRERHRASAAAMA